MTKAELVAKIASEGGIIKSQAEKALDGFVSAVSAAYQAVTRLRWWVSGLSASGQGLNVKAAITGPAKRSKFRSQKLSSSKQVRLTAKKSNSRIYTKLRSRMYQRTLFKNVGS